MQQKTGDGAPDSAAGPPHALALLAGQALLMTAAGVGLWLLSGRSLDGFITFSWAQTATGIVFAAALIAVAATLFRAFPETSERLIRLQSDTYRFLGPQLSWPAIVAISLCAGISEEAALRAGLQTLLGDSLGPVAAIAVSSAVFAALHLAKPVITGLLFGIGILFGAVYWQTGSLLAVMIAHVLYDVWALRHLNREMHRLGLFETPPTASAALANSPTEG